MLRAWLGLACAAAGWLAAAGCAQPYDGPPLVAVTGLVTWQGEPLGGALLTFLPQGNTPGQGGSARTDAAGRFSLATPDGGQAGLCAGNYRVIISKPVRPDGSDLPPEGLEDPMSAAFRELLPPRYSSFEDSTLTADVPAEGAELEFPLKGGG